MKNKKAQIAQLFPMVIALVTIAIVLVVGFLIFAEVKTSITASTAVPCVNYSGDSRGTTLACNGTLQVTEAMEDIPGWLPIIVITVIGALLIGLVSYFRQK